MIFEDEDARTNYHKCSSLLQMIVQVLESLAFQYHHQTYLIAVLNDTQVLVGCPNMKSSYMKAIVDKINQQFKRVDEHPTCIVQDSQLGAFSVMADLGSDLSELV